MRSVAIILFSMLAVSAWAQAPIYRQFFTTNAAPVVDVVAGSNATVQASTPAANIRRFTVNGTPTANADFLTSGTVTRPATNSAVSTGTIIATNISVSGATSNYLGGVTVATNLTAVGTFTGDGAGLTNLTGISGSGSGFSLATCLQTVTLFDDCIGILGGGSIGGGVCQLSYKTTGGLWLYLIGESNAPGIHRLSTSTSATAFIHEGDSTDGASRPFVTSLGNYTNEWRVRWTQLPTGSENFTNYVGLHNGSSGAIPSSGVFFGFDTNDVHLKTYIAKAGSMTVSTNTTTVSAGVWYKLQVATYNSGSNAVFTVDGGDVVAMSGANMPAVAIGPTASMVKGGGTTACTFDIDYCYAGYSLNSAR